MEQTGLMANITSCFISSLVTASVLGSEIHIPLSGSALIIIAGSEIYIR